MQNIKLKPSLNSETEAGNAFYGLWVKPKQDQDVATIYSKDNKDSYTCIWFI